MMIFKVVLLGMLGYDNICACDNMCAIRLTWLYMAFQ